MPVNDSVNELIKVIQHYTGERQGLERQLGINDKIYRWRSIFWASSNKLNVLEFGHSILQRSQGCGRRLFEDVRCAGWTNPWLLIILQYSTYENSRAAKISGQRQESIYDPPAKDKWTVIHACCAAVKIN